MPVLKIIADSALVNVKDYFADLGQLMLLPTAQINVKNITTADILLVRSVTAVNQQLLQGSQIRFVGTASAGFDNLDTTYLDQKNIRWACAPGCNAHAVADYVLCCIASLLAHGFITKPLKQLKAGVIGVGHVGCLVVERLQQLGMTVIQHDPPKAAKDKNFHSTSLTEFKNLDMVCLHPALTKTGSHPSVHLIDKIFLQQQGPGTILLNAARGEIINTADLKKYGQHCHWAFDVWEGEPDIDLEILQKAVIATPHIAGYSIEAKTRATKMLRDAFNRANYLAHYPAPFSHQGREKLKNLNRANLKKYLKFYQPLRDTQMMKGQLCKKGINVAETFNSLRKNYPLRNEIVS